MIERGLRVLILLVLCCSPLFGSGPEALSVHAVSVDFPLISIRVKLIASEPIEIGTGTFQIEEEGIRISGFTVASATPRQIIAFLLDRSSSLENQMKDVRRSAVAFLKSLPDGLKIEVLSFASDIEINQEFTLSRTDLISAVEKIRPWGGTTLYDAVYLACDRLYSNSDPRDFRTLILFTDGRDETPVTREQMSIRNLNEALAFARKRQVRIIAVGMGNQIDQGVLQRLASETGGWYMFAPTAHALFSIYERISRLMKAERHFQLSYHSPNQDRNGEKRAVKVVTQPHSAPPQERLIAYSAPLPLKPGTGYFRTRPSMSAQQPPSLPQSEQPSPVQAKPAFEIKIKEMEHQRSLELPPFPDTSAPASTQATPTSPFQ